MNKEVRDGYIKRLWNANTADEIAAILDEYDAEQLPKKPQPNWDKAPDWAQWWAVDEDGFSFWYENKPVERINEWDDYSRALLVVCDELDLQCFDWRQTLTKRP